jgi:hypothetical protein
MAGPTALVAPAAHQADGPTTLEQNTAPLEGRGTTRANFRLARGLGAPSNEVPPHSRASRPPRVRFRPARGLGTPSSEVPPRSRGGRPPRVSFRLARGPRGLVASAPVPPTGAFNALTFAGAQAKDESTPHPWHAWESRPGAVPPPPPVRPFPPLCGAVR